MHCFPNLNDCDDFRFISYTADIPYEVVLFQPGPRAPRPLAGEPVFAAGTAALPAGRQDHSSGKTPPAQTSHRFDPLFKREYRVDADPDPDFYWLLNWTRLPAVNRSWPSVTTVSPGSNPFSITTF